MRSFSLPAVGLVVSMSLSAWGQSPALVFPDLAPPTAAVQPVTNIYHGETDVDPYQWLEDGKSPATREWLKAEEEYTEQMIAGLPGRDEIAKRAATLLKVDSYGTPSYRKGLCFFSRRLANEDVASLCLRQGLTGKDEVLVAPGEISQDGKTTLNFMEISRDATLLAFGIRTGGEDEVAIGFYDLPARKRQSLVLPKARYSSFNFTPDKTLAYYTIHDQKTGPRAYVRTLATGETREIFGDKLGPEKILSVSLSDDAKWLVYHIFYGASSRNDVWFQPADLSKPATVLIEGEDAEFELSTIDHRAVMRTTSGSPRAKLMLVDLTKPARSEWKEIVSERPSTLEGVSLAGGKIYLRWLENVVSKITVHDLAGTELGTIALEAMGSITSISGDWDETEAFYSFSSIAIPPTIYQLSTATGTSAVWNRSAIPVDVDKYTIRQVWYPSKDGTKIPMFIVARKDVVLDGSNPTLLYGYGGFNVSLTPTFSTKAVLWLEQGGVYAVANLRGGGEFGEEWHQAGMRHRKQNVFDDFYAAAEYLIAEKYTSPAHLAINGGSNGGLLVGTAMTQRPDLYAAVVCTYPLLDMLRFHNFLVARFWVPEYGSSEDPELYKTLKAYSPYHHIREGVNYPAALYITGDADTRVDPLHARKMVARLQAVNPKRPTLLHYDMALGHTGARPVSKTVDDLSLELAFLKAATGATKTASIKSTDANTTLEDYFDREWERGLKEGPTFASYLGDKRYNDKWPDLSQAAIDHRLSETAAALKEIKAIPRAELSIANQLNYDLYVRQLEECIEEAKFRWYLVPLTQREGIQDENSLGDALSFTTVKGYQDWITRLETFPGYMDQTIALMTEGVKAGIVQPRITMKRVPDQIRKQIVENPADSLFYTPFKKFPTEINASEQLALKARAEAAIRDKVIPAYRKLLTFFEETYLPACYEGAGAWNLANGKDLYEFRVRQFTTLPLTAKQVHEIGLAEVARIRGEMEAIKDKVGFKGTLREFFEYLRKEPKFYYGSEAELMVEYQAFCKRIDPQLTRLFRKLPRIPYGVEAIPANMAPDTTAGYYRPPSADGLRAGTFFVNLYQPKMRPKYEIPALSLHESVPGHHLQIALATEMENVPTFRRFTGFTAYVEGWALYSERLGEEMGAYDDPYAKFGQLTYEMWRAVRLVVDTGIHAFQWPREQAIEFFREHTAKTELDIVNEVDRYISWPGQALGYKIGELKIRELRTKAEKTLGDRFDLREFHDVILRDGAVPLEILERRVNDWLKTASGTSE